MSVNKVIVIGYLGANPNAKIILRFERTNTLPQRLFLSPLLILGEGEGEVTRIDPWHRSRPQWCFARKPFGIIFALGLTP